MKIIDISQEILSCKVYPGDPTPKGNKVICMDDGEVYNLSAFSMCAHNGTHVDAPLHFINAGKSIDQMALESFVGMCYVARHTGDLSAKDAEDILSKASNAGASDRILIAGEATITDEAAKVFVSANIKLIGNEGQTVGPEDAPMEVHLIFLNKGIVLLEGIVLTDAKEGTYFLNAAPLNIAGFEGAPCRAYLIEGEILC